MHAIKRFTGYRPDLGMLLLRLGVGITFLVHGILKLQDIAGTTGFFGAINIPAPAFFAWVVALVETLGGLALIIGFGAHLAAFLLAIVMIVAMLSVKFKAGFVGGWEFDFTLLAGLLAILFTGPLKYSLDAKCKCKYCTVQPVSEINQ